MRSGKTLEIEGFYGLDHCGRWPKPPDYISISCGSSFFIPSPYRSSILHKIVGHPPPSPMVVPRIPYTLPFPPPAIRPFNAITLPAAIAAVTGFLQSQNTVLLTGAGISVESGLADYRGEKGTYRLNQKYKPMFFSEFVGNHESRKRSGSPSRGFSKAS